MVTANSGSRRWGNDVSGLTDEKGGSGQPADTSEERVPPMVEVPNAGGMGLQPGTWLPSSTVPASQQPFEQAGGEVYGALDLGTNNCRLLLARPSRRGFRVVDAFSRIIRLGEGLSQSGRLSPVAMNRTVDALKICAGKLQRHNVNRFRLVATEACRSADNGDEFLERVYGELQLDLEILTPEDEASLAVAGCAALIDLRADYVLVFDIGGGSSELIWLDLQKAETIGRRSVSAIMSSVANRSGVATWTSLPVGVVTLAEKFGGQFVTSEVFEAMVTHVEG